MIDNARRPLPEGMEHLEVLLLENCEADAKLIEVTLERSGLAIRAQRIDRWEDLLKALGGEVHVLLCNYVLPGIDPLNVITEVRQRRPDLPVIIVSGSMGEEFAVAAIRAGADDYVLKDRLERLGIAVQQAMERKLSSASGVGPRRRRGFSSERSRRRGRGSCCSTRPRRRTRSSSRTRPFSSASGARRPR